MGIVTRGFGGRLMFSLFDLLFRDTMHMPGFGSWMRFENCPESTSGCRGGSTSAAAWVEQWPHSHMELALNLATCPLAHASTPEDVGLSGARLQAISSVLHSDVERGKIPGAVVLVARRGRVAWFEAIGSERQGDSSRPMQRHSVFRMAALTRPVVSVAALMLMEEGRLALSDP